MTNNFSRTPPTLHAGLDLKGYASARLQVLVYGVVGPYADVAPYLKLEADIFATPWWQLYGGLEVPVGVRIDLLGYEEIASYEVLAIGAKQLITQASTPPPTPHFALTEHRLFTVEEIGYKWPWTRHIHPWHSRQ